jgi:hypothetical protein
MANTLAPFGFKQFGTASGPPNFAQNSNPPYRIAADGSAIYYGDAVRMESGGPTGYVVPWVAGDGGTASRILVGIFLGCQYYSTSQRQTVWSNFWPGAGATGDVTAFVADDPNSQWVVQASAGPITQVSIGQTADIAAGPTGNTVTGISGMTLAAPGTSATAPFKVVNIITAPPGANGTDIASANNYVIVSFNNQQYKSLVGV